MMDTGALFDDTEYRSSWDLADRFLVPPFSVLDTRSGRWRERRARWDLLDMTSRSGRSDALTFAKGQGTDPVSQKLLAMSDGTSTFDPVLCEIIYRWWTPADGVILDPFAGGSVRGIVASVLGRPYHGVDLSLDQIDANEDAAARLAASLGPAPRWYQHDSAQWQPDIKADAIVSCPPYGTLERYSDNPLDLSTMPFDRFRDAYRAAIQRSVNRLKADRFAVFVVGNYREGRVLRDLVGATIDAFGRAGCDYYGDLALLNAAGTAGMRGSASFNAGRKPIMTHQHVVVFVKGDWRKAAAAAERIDPTEFDASDVAS